MHSPRIVAGAGGLLLLMAADPPVDDDELKPELEPRSTRRPPGRRRVFEEWWPVVLRVTGLGVALVHIAVAQLGHGEYDETVLGFCATLVLVSLAGKDRDE